MLSIVLCNLPYNLLNEERILLWLKQTLNDDSITAKSILTVFLEGIIVLTLQNTQQVHTIVKKLHGRIFFKCRLCVTPVESLPFKLPDGPLAIQKCIENLINYWGDKFIYEWINVLLQDSTSQPPNCIRTAVTLKDIRELYQSEQQCYKAVLHCSYDAEYRREAVNNVGANQCIRTVVEQVRTNPLNRLMNDVCIEVGKKRSNILKIQNFVDCDITFDETLVNRIKDAFLAKANLHGDVLSIVIPPNDNFERGCSLFIEYKSDVAACIAQKDFNGLRFGGNTICCCFYPAELFYSSQYELTLI